MKTPEQALEEMCAINLKHCREPETRHSKGDDLLCELLRQEGYGEVVDEFESRERGFQ